MSERLSPEHMPPQYVRDVFFDGGLVDMAHDIEQLDMTEAVDRFWSELYLSCLPEPARKFMSDEDISILDLHIIPTNYDIETETVSILLTSRWEYPPHGAIKKGYAILLELRTDGTFLCEHISGTLRYSSSMTSHIADLWAHTATWPGYKSLHPENFAD